MTTFRLSTTTLAVLTALTLTACGGKSGFDGPISSTTIWDSNRNQANTANSSNTNNQTNTANTNNSGANTNNTSDKESKPNQDSDKFTTAATLSDNGVIDSPVLPKNIYGSKTNQLMKSEIKKAFDANSATESKFDTGSDYSATLTQKNGTKKVSFKESDVISTSKLGNNFNEYTLDERLTTRIDGIEHKADLKSQVKLYQQQDSLVMGQKTLSGTIQNTKDSSKNISIKEGALRIDHLKGTPFKKPSDEQLKSAKDDLDAKLKAVDLAKEQIAMAQNKLLTAQNFEERKTAHEALTNAINSFDVARKEVPDSHNLYNEFDAQSKIFAKDNEVKFNYTGQAFDKDDKVGKLNYQVNFSAQTGYGKITDLNSGDINLNEANLKTIQHTNPDSNIKFPEGSSNQTSMLGIQGTANFTQADRKDGTYTLGIFGKYAEEVAGVITEDNVNTVGFGGRTNTSVAPKPVLPDTSPLPSNLGLGTANNQAKSFANKDSDKFTTASPAPGDSVVKSNLLPKNIYTAELREDLHNKVANAYGQRFNTTFQYNTMLTDNTNKSNTTKSFKNNAIIPTSTLGDGLQDYTMNEVLETNIDGVKYTGERKSRVKLYQQDNSLVLGMQTLSGTIFDSNNTKKTDIKGSELRIDHIKGMAFNRPSKDDIKTAEDDLAGKNKEQNNAKEAELEAKESKVILIAEQKLAKFKLENEIKTGIKSAELKIKLAEDAVKKTQDDKAIAELKDTIAAEKLNIQNMNEQLNALQIAQRADLIKADKIINEATKKLTESISAQIAAQAKLNKFLKQDKIFTENGGQTFSYTGKAFNKDSIGELEYHINFNTLAGHGEITNLNTGKINLNESELQVVNHTNPDTHKTIEWAPNTANATNILGVQGVAQFEDGRKDGKYTLGIFGDYAEEVAGFVTEDNVNTVGFGGKR